MFATCIGIVFLILSATLIPTPLAEKAESFLPWVFLFGLFMSLILWTLKGLLWQKANNVPEKRKDFCVSTPIAFLGLLSSLIPPSTGQEQWAVGTFLMFFFWLDAFLYDVRTIKKMRTFEGMALVMKKQLKKAIQTKDMKKIISEFEAIFLVIENTFSKNNSQDLQQAASFFKECVDLIIAAIPQMSQLVGEQEGETLIDKYFLFQAVVAKKMERLSSIIRETPNDLKWDLLIKLLSQMTATFLPLHESFGAPFLLNLSELAHFLQKNGSPKEMEVYAGCVEAAKAVLDHCLQKKKIAKTYVGPILNPLEILMKERFRHDRTLNAAYLMQPFAEIAEYLADSSFLQVPGRDELMGDLKRILSQFAVLETVSERMGEVHPTDTTSTYREDIPYMRPTKESKDKTDMEF